MEDEKNKIVQFSTIGALMCGVHDGEFPLHSYLSSANPNSVYNFGLGCSDKVNAEVIIYDGVAYTGTAKEAVAPLDKDDRSPFIQIMNFQTHSSSETVDHPRHYFTRVNQETLNEDNFFEFMQRHVKTENVFVAICIEAVFSSVTIRRPQRIPKEVSRTMVELAAEQQVDTYTNQKGVVVGLYTPDVFGRLSVPGFHFHFITDDRKEGGHVLHFMVESGMEATVRLEEKNRYEVVLPESEAYRQGKVELGSLDEVIHKVEK